MKFGKFTVIVLLFVNSLVLFSSTSSAGGWLEFFFPTVKTEPTPAETLKAPFADQDMVIEEMDALGNASNMTPLHLKHRTNDVIERWVQEVVPEMLSYTSNGYVQQFSKKIINFSKAGSDEYKVFLQSANYITTLKAGNYSITGFVTNYPVILNEGSVEGSYSWVFQTDVMVTYQNITSDYKLDKGKNSISKEFTLTFQISRNRKSTNKHGVLIESWSVKPKKTK